MGAKAGDGQDSRGDTRRQRRGDGAHLIVAAVGPRQRETTEVGADGLAGASVLVGERACISNTGNIDRVTAANAIHAWCARESCRGGGVVYLVLGAQAGDGQDSRGDTRRQWRGDGAHLIVAAGGPRQREATEVGADGLAGTSVLVGEHACIGNAGDIDRVTAEEAIQTWCARESCRGGG